MHRDQAKSQPARMMASFGLVCTDEQMDVLVIKESSKTVEKLFRFFLKLSMNTKAIQWGKNNFN